MTWTHLSDTTPRARKRHQCCLCGEVIEREEQHVARRGISEGVPITSRMHPECEAATRDWDDETWETVEPGDLDRPRKESDA
jgi:hypothetical protein